VKKPINLGDILGEAFQNTFLEKFNKSAVTTNAYKKKEPYRRRISWPKVG